MSNIKHSQKQRQGVVIQPDATILSGIVPRKTEKLFSRVLPTLIFHVADFLYGIWPWKSRGQTPERRSPHLTNPNPFQTQQVFFSPRSTLRDLKDLSSGMRTRLPCYAISLWLLPGVLWVPSGVPTGTLNQCCQLF